MIKYGTKEYYEEKLVLETEKISTLEYLIETAIKAGDLTVQRLVCSAGLLKELRERQGECRICLDDMKASDEKTTQEG